jgi:hypothetical protein
VDWSTTGVFKNNSSVPDHGGFLTAASMERKYVNRKWPLANIGVGQAAA